MFHWPTSLFICKNVQMGAGPKKECTMKKLQIGLIALLGTILWVACEERPPTPVPPGEIPLFIIDDDPGDSNEFI